VPPHLRGKAAAAAAATAAAKPGIRFPSNVTGDEAQNVKYAAAPREYRNGNQLRSAKYSALSRKLATRKLRAKPVKPILKRGRQRTAKLRARSANKVAPKKKTSGAKSA
jgi:hypothetical protein